MVCSLDSHLPVNLFRPAIMNLPGTASRVSLPGFISVAVSVVSLRCTPRGY